MHGYRSFIHTTLGLLTTLIMVILPTGCQTGTHTKLEYATLGSITTYNTTTVVGASSASPQAFARTLLGFSYHGPNGEVVPDQDFGTISLVSSTPLIVDYRINDQAVYSDGVPITCDDVLLAWIAQSGQIPDFNAASQAGYRDISNVDCTPGHKEARVTFYPGREFSNYRELFTATSLLPSHILTKHLGFNVTEHLLHNDNPDDPALHRIASLWNTIWDLKPGTDLDDFPSSGPYKLDNVDPSGAIRLVSNPRWWGLKPHIPKIIIWPYRHDLADQIAHHRIHIVDIETGSAGVIIPPDDYHSTTIASDGIEQLIFNTQGLFEDPALRRAFAFCIPRDRIAEEIKIPLANRRLDTVDEDALHGPELIPESQEFSHPHLEQIQEITGGAPLEIRLGYHTPNTRLAAISSIITESCAPAGIRIIDRSSPNIGPLSLNNDDIDVLLSSVGGATGSGSTGSSSLDAYALHCTNGNNLGNYCQGRIDEIIDELAITISPTEQTRLLTEAAFILWADMPTLPLYRQYRTILYSTHLFGVSPNPTRWGVGWNMDRWDLQQ